MADTDVKTYAENRILIVLSIRITSTSTFLG